VKTMIASNVLELNQKIRRRISEPNLREMLVGSIVGFVVKILSALCLFLMNIVVARTLGPSEAGLFFLGLTLITIVASIGRIGLEQVTVRFIAACHAIHDSDGVQAIYRKAVAWVAVISTLLAFTVWGSAEWITKTLFNQPGFEVVLGSFALAIPLVALYTIQAHALQGLKRIAKSMLTLSVLAPGAMLFFLMVNPVYSAREASLYFNISCAATLIAGVYFWMKSSPIAERSVSFSSQKLKQACIPLWFVIILAQVSQWSSQMMLGAWSTADNVAFFATAQRTAMLTSFVLFAVNSIAAPKFSALYAKGDMAGLEKTAIWSVRLMWTIAVPVLLFITLTSEWLMGFFGKDFKEASLALIILAVGQFVNIATGSVGYLLSMTGHERALRNNSIISALLGVALGALLIPDYGLIGASISTAAAIACQNLLGVYQVRKHLGFNVLMIRG
tara:strand:+ start:7889 stop:9226 length:1338 start_codon:yes stop_codon:yes gene_type:complete